MTILTQKQMYKSLADAFSRSVEYAYKDMLDAAVRAEREACAKVCESLFDADDNTCNEAERCAQAIRARNNT